MFDLRIEVLRAIDREEAAGVVTPDPAFLYAVLALAWVLRDELPGG